VLQVGERERGDRLGDQSHGSRPPAGCGRPSSSGSGS
jgi:hypothetical protein